MRTSKFLVAALLLLAACTKDIHVDRLVINPTDIVLAVGDTQLIEASFLSGIASTLEWTSSSPEVATVAPDGTVTAVAPGSATVTVHCKEANMYAVCSVFVRGYKSELVAGVLLPRHELTLYLGENVQFSATVLPETAVNRNVIWSSSVTGVAWIDQEGYMITLLPGTTIISVTTEEGGFTDECTVTVLPAYVYVESVHIPESWHLDVGESAQLELTITPSDAANKNVTWVSLDESVVTVTQEGVITGVAPGSTAVKVTTEEGGHRAYCYVTVFDPSEE